MVKILYSSRRSKFFWAADGIEGHIYCSHEWMPEILEKKCGNLISSSLFKLHCEEGGRRDPQRSCMKEQTLSQCDIFTLSRNIWAPDIHWYMWVIADVGAEHSKHASLDMGNFGKGI